jgi:hypothetical protein
MSPGQDLAARTAMVSHLDQLASELEAQHGPIGETTWTRVAAIITSTASGITAEVLTGIANACLQHRHDNILEQAEAKKNNADVSEEVGFA